MFAIPCRSNLRLAFDRLSPRDGFSKSHTRRNLEHTWGIWLLLILLSTGLSNTARAESLLVTGPKGDLILTQEDILAISTQEMVTNTPWTDGNHTFRGAPLARVLEQAGIEPDWLEALALNDYSIELPVARVLEADAFLAVSMDGELMPIRDKGPFWIIFPWNTRPELLTREVHAWSVWQLQALRVID